MKTIISPNSKTKLPDITPDEALDTLRSLIYAHERTLFNNLDMSRENAEAETEDAHAALAFLQQYVDFREDGIEVKLAAGRKAYQDEKKSGEWKET